MGEYYSYINVKTKKKTDLEKIIPILSEYASYDVSSLTKKNSIIIDEVSIREYDMEEMCKKIVDALKEDVFLIASTTNIDVDPYLGLYTIINGEYNEDIREEVYDEELFEDIGYGNCINDIRKWLSRTEIYVNEDTLSEFKI